MSGGGHTLAEVLQGKGTFVCKVDKTTPVAEAVAYMNQLHMGSVVVVDDDLHLLGILTERDILVRVTAAHRSMDQLLVADVMTTDVVAVKPTMTVNDAACVMTVTHCRHLPVIVGDQVRGLVSLGDLNKWLIHESEERITDLMGYITRG